MSDASTGRPTHARSGAVPEPGRSTAGPDALVAGSSGWNGWIAFASVMMVLVGSFHAIQGLVALVKDEYFLVGADGLVVQVDYTTWGWAHLASGILVACAGGALMAGRTWARIVAVLFAFGSAILNVAFLSAYPVWSAVMIAVDVLVIWAVVVHGRDLRELPGPAS